MKEITINFEETDYDNIVLVAEEAGVEPELMIKSIVKEIMAGALAHKKQLGYIPKLEINE